MCEIEDCLKPTFRRSWCAGHYHRWRRYGDPLGGPPDRPALTYAGIHAKLAHLYGPARSHLCSWCFEGADEWAYLHTDSNSSVDRRGPWSPWVEHYAPLCLSCHQLFDDRARSNIERNAGIRLAVALGETQVSVARQFGISRQRVHQIVRVGQSQPLIH